MKGLLNYKKNLKLSILSLSLLTVMAGAAVAPALGVIKEYFAGVNQLFIQMIISVPAVFIVLTNLVFPKLFRKFTAKELVVGGLALYIVGGCAAGLFSNIWLVLIMRGIVGIGVGILMPLSTGLLAFYFSPGEQEHLMGLSSAMNQMGGVIATLLAGLLSGISWRMSFMVYILGLISLIPCIIFIPSRKIARGSRKKAGIDSAALGDEGEVNEELLGAWESAGGEIGADKGSSVFRSNWKYIVCMFLLMTTFFIYPSNFAIETTSEGIIPHHLIAVIMAMMDFVAFFGGLLFVTMKKVFKGYVKLLAPVLFLAGYALLAIVGGWIGIIVGSICVGFANGAGIPFIMSGASMSAGKSAATTVMPMISAALYLAQFLCPVLMFVINALFGGLGVTHLPYWFAIGLAILFGIISAFISDSAKNRDSY